MIIGLDKFRTHFASFTQCYVLIGGSASSLAMEELGAEFRVTKDLDIVLCVESLDAEFGRAFWEFIKAGGYETRQLSTGERKFYRFNKPSQSDYPVMLELFSRAPDALSLPTEATLTPIPLDEEISSLSAILMDTDYYAFVLQHRVIIGGLSLIKAEALIPLKAMAYLDLGDRQANGEAVDSKNIKKHRNDIFRLSTTLNAEQNISLPERLLRDLNKAFARMAQETAELDLKSLGIPRRTSSDVISELRRIYGLNKSS